MTTQDIANRQMMAIEKDVALLTQRISHAEKNISRLENEHKVTVETLRRIDTQLSQIKWILTGAVLSVVAQQVGIVSALKGML